MKYISEEKLNKFLDENFSSCYSCGEIGGYDDLKEEISELYEEIDTLTVTKLRPMADAPIETHILAFNGNSFAIVDSTFGKAYRKLFEGWIPMTIYQPNDIVNNDG